MIGFASASRLHSNDNHSFHTTSSAHTNLHIRSIDTESILVFLPMSKSKAKRKQQGSQPGGGPVAKKLKTDPQVTVTVTVTPKLVNTLVPEEDLEITVDTLRILAEHPSLIKSKACKDLRTAAFEFRKACTTGFNAAGSSRSRDIFPQPSKRNIERCVCIPVGTPN